MQQKVGKDGRKLVEGWALLAWGTTKQISQFFGEVVKVTAKDRLMAMEALADRGFGKARQTIDFDGMLRTDDLPDDQLDLRIQAVAAALAAVTAGNGNGHGVH